MSMNPFVEDGAYSDRAAVVDLGSNTVKVVCYSADHTGAYRPYHRESVRVRLDEYGDGMVGDKAADKLIEALALFRNIIRYEKVGRVMAVATSAVRSADNRESLMSRVTRETGFEFVILSGSEEALYSYAGAATHLDIPTSVFFDIGGGSMEMVSSRNHTITRAFSLPLGALVMTRRFARESDFDASSTKRLRKYLRDALPGPDSLGPLGDDTILVGVGGTLRILAKCAQSAGYPLKKMHNYVMEARTIRDVTEDILSRDRQTLAGMYEVGRGRADIIKAGAVVISELVEGLGFDRLTVSAAGLREGVLELTMRYPDFGPHHISEYHVRELVRAPPGTPRIIREAAGIVKSVLSSGRLTGEESEILRAAAVGLGRLRTFRDADDFLYSMMNQTSILSHRIQLLSALCLCYSKKPKRTKLLMERYQTILRDDDRRIIKRLSSVLDLCSIVVVSGADVHILLDDTGMRVLVRRGQHLPRTLFGQACQRVGSALDAETSIVYEDAPEDP